jgi:hypothetical protein
MLITLDKMMFSMSYSTMCFTATVFYAVVKQICMLSAIQITPEVIKQAEEKQIRACLGVSFRIPGIVQSGLENNLGATSIIYNLISKQVLLGCHDASLKSSIYYPTSTGPPEGKITASWGSRRY